jgi:hypothetical protein
MIATSPDCCGAQKARPWADGSVETPVGPVVRARTRLDFADRLGSWKARWGIGRMRYKVEPGLYAVGDPTPESRVFVTANYKMSFDRLRSALAGRNGWIMVLDSRGINVWCAAGAGNFGTDEVVNRAEAVRLSEVVSHRTLILPQLGASGVAAHEVAKRTGFTVVYGPVRAEDLPTFLDAGMKPTADMRRVRFDFRDRIVLAPMELVIALRYALPVAAALAVLSGLSREGYSVSGVASEGVRAAVVLLATCLLSVLAIAGLLPWLPGRSFSVKGAWAGAAMDAVLVMAVFAGAVRPGAVETCAWLLLIPSIAGFIALNFTGATTITSLSGVRTEMRRFIPFQAVGAGLGMILWVAALFV